MPRFPSDAPLDRVLAAMAKLGFHVVRAGNHIALARRDDDGNADAYDDSESPPAQTIDATNHPHSIRYFARRVPRCLRGLLICQRQHPDSLRCLSDRIGTVAWRFMSEVLARRRT